MMQVSNKKIWSYVMLGIGIGCILGSLVVKESTMSGYIMGLGAGLTGASVAQLIKYHKLFNTEEKRESYQIEVEDPRNTEIRTTARARAGFYLDCALVGLVLILPFTNAPFWVTVVLIVLFLGYEVLTYSFIKRLNNKI